MAHLFRFKKSRPPGFSNSFHRLQLKMGPIFKTRGSGEYLRTRLHVPFDKSMRERERERERDKERENFKDVQSRKRGEVYGIS